MYVQFTKPGTAVNSEKDRMLILAAETVEQAKQAVAMLLDGVSQVVRWAEWHGADDGVAWRRAGWRRAAVPAGQRGSAG